MTSSNKTTNRSNTNMKCKICDQDTESEFQVREMMFGFRDSFTYCECGECGCLQLSDPPADLSKYYDPDHYYSFRSTTQEVLPTGLRLFVKKKRDAAILFRRHGFFSWLAKRYPNPGISDIERWLGQSPIRSYGQRILDVGCGNGHLLKRLRDLGFRSLTGVDPYLPASEVKDGVHLLATDIDDVEGEFDFVMLHHSFEHVPNPIEVLTSVCQRLTAGGVCLVRVPIVSQGPWARYGSNWAEIDAPRHFFLHSEKSMSLSAQAAGLKVFHIDYEPEVFAYVCSELYQKDLSLYDDATGTRRRFDEEFTSSQLQEFDELSNLNNIPGFASRAGFYLSRRDVSIVSASLLPSAS